MSSNYKKQGEFLKRNFERGNLAHAYLFSGQDVESIENFTKDFLKLINGKDFEGMIDKNNFPDLLIVKSSDSKSSIDNAKDMMEVSIEQIRNAQNFLSYKPYYGIIKAVIIENAERMTKEAQNCFLKTLEEPKGETIIFLVTSKPDFLLSTISSRCQHVKFLGSKNTEISKEEEIILQNFKRVMNSDLAERFNYAKSMNFEGENFLKILSIIEKYLRQQLLSQLDSGSNSRKITNSLKLIERLSYNANTANINQKMAMEILLLEL